MDFIGIKYDLLGYYVTYIDAKAYGYHMLCIPYNAYSLICQDI